MVGVVTCSAIDHLKMEEKTKEKKLCGLETKFDQIYSIIPPGASLESQSRSA